MISRRKFLHQVGAGAAVLAISAAPAVAAPSALSLRVNERFAAYLAIQEKRRLISNECDRRIDALPAGVFNALATDGGIERCQKLTEIAALESRFEAMYDDKEAISEELAAIEDRTGNADLIGARILMMLDMDHDLIFKGMNDLDPNDLSEHGQLHVAALRSLESQMTGLVHATVGELVAAFALRAKTP